MTVTIIQGLWKEGSKKKKIIVKVLLVTGLWKEGSKNFILLWTCLWPQGYERKAIRQKNIVKVLMATWRSEILDCVLSPMAYLH
jgi:hypothetical protein